MSDGKFSHIALLLLPPKLRLERMVAFARMLISQLEVMRNLLPVYRTAKLKELRYNGQVATIERVLNEQFFGGVSLVVITDSPLIQANYLHNASEAATPTYLFNADETPDVQVYVYNASEYAAQFSFYVNIPAELEGSFSEELMEQVIDFYRPAGRSFTIEYYE